MPEMNVHDVISRFHNSIIMYGNRPCFVKRVKNDYVCELFDLLGQELIKVEFDMGKFKPVGRIGMVNINGSVLYCYRAPKRMYKVGISLENLSVNQIDGADRDGRDREKIKRLDSVELGRAIMGKYPTFLQALRNAKQFEGTFAFDRQFAVNHANQLIYKTNVVGIVENDKSITFNQGFEHLALLLDNNYATETVRNFAATAR